MKALIQRILMGSAGTAALAVAAGVCVVSAAYALYAALRIDFGPAAAAGLTSLASGFLVAVLAVVLILLRGAAKPRQPERRRLDPEVLQNVVTVGTALAGVAADLVLQHRLEHKHAKPKKRGWGRR